MKKEIIRYLKTIEMYSANTTTFENISEIILKLLKSKYLRRHPRQKLDEQEKEEKKEGKIKSRVMGYGGKKRKLKSKQRLHFARQHLKQSIGRIYSSVEQYCPFFSFPSSSHFSPNLSTFFSLLF